MADISSTPDGRVFISYRREDTAYSAGWLYDRLADHLGADKVFKDIDSIELGDDFVEVITTAVGSCDVLLALIGDQWLTIADEDGRRRLDDPADFVRLEIEAALGRDVRVIPVLVDGATMPRAEDLPASLAMLERRQALELSPSRFDFDSGRLLRVLDRTFPEVHDQEGAMATPTTPLSDPPDEEQRMRSPTRPEARRRWVWAAAAAVVLVVLLVAAVALSGSGNTNERAQLDEYVDAISENPDATPCVARAIVETVGLDQVEAVATPDEIRENPEVLDETFGTLSEDQANTFYDHLSDCPEDKTYLVALAARVIGDGDTLTSEKSDCVQRQVSEKLARQIFISWWTQPSNTSLNDAAFDAIQPCLGPLRLMPNSGPPATMIQLSAEPCTPPNGWTNGGVAFGVLGDEATETQSSLGSDGSWQGQLRIPAGATAGTYNVWANCWADSPDGQTTTFHQYRNATFQVTQT